MAQIILSSPDIYCPSDGQGGDFIDGPSGKTDSAGNFSPHGKDSVWRVGYTSEFNLVHRIPTPPRPRGRGGHNPTPLPTIFFFTFFHPRPRRELFTIQGPPPSTKEAHSGGAKRRREKGRWLRRGDTFFTCPRSFTLR